MHARGIESNAPARHGTRAASGPRHGTVRTPRLVFAACVFAARSLTSEVALAQAISPPTLVQDVAPAYPASASGDAAEVVLLLTVDRDGHVSDAKVVESGGDAFDAAALDAAKRLLFAPAKKNGAPVAARIRFRFRFAPPPPRQPATSPPPSTPAAERVAPGQLRVAVRTARDAPIAGAAISVERIDGAAAPIARTANERGIATFEDLPRGRYRVRVESPGYEAAGYEEDVRSGTGTDATYRLSEPAKPTEVVVRGEKAQREVTRYTLTPQDIVKSPGTNGDALRAVENLPGVARPPATTGALIVRGAAPQDTSVFVDGTVVPLVYHFGGLTSVIPTEALERLDFTPGNFGPEYGRALGGVVNVGLKSPRTDRVGGLAKVDLLDARVFAEGPISERVRFLVGARRSWVDAWIAPVLRQTGNGVATAPVYYDGQALLEVDVSPTTTARVAFFGSSDALRLTLSAPDPSDPVPGALGVRTDFWRVQARLESRFGGDRVRLTNMVSWGQDVLAVQQGGLFLDIDSRPLNYRGEARVRAASNIAVIGGMDLQQTTADVSIRVPPQGAATDAPSPTFARPPAVVTQNGSASYLPAAYAGVEWKPSPSLKILPSVRVDYAKEEKRWDVSPRVNARWDITRGAYRTALKGGVGIYSQPAQPYEAIPPYGTPHLLSNRSMHESIGVEQGLAPGLSVSVEGFVKVLDHLVVPAEAAGSAISGVSYANTGTGRVVGAETFVRLRREGVSAWIAYTLSRSERRDRDGGPLYLFPYDQTHILTALATYAAGKGWELGARFRFISGNPATPYVGGVSDLDAGAYAAVPGAPFSTRLPAFHQLDLRVEKSWTAGEFRLAAYLDLQNVYNRQNPEGLTYNFNYTRSAVMAGLPILPVLGLRGEL